MVSSIWSWLTVNREWVFSGIGVAALSVIVAFVFQRRRAAPSQHQQSGHSSVNIQAGGDIDLGRREDKPK
jgi:hypothetical protein